MKARQVVGNEAEKELEETVVAIDRVDIDAIKAAIIECEMDMKIDETRAKVQIFQLHQGYELHESKRKEFAMMILSQESKQFEQFCEKYCNDNGIDLVCQLIEKESNFVNSMKRAQEWQSQNMSNIEMNQLLGFDTCDNDIDSNDGNDGNDGNNDSNAYENSINERKENVLSDDDSDSDLDYVPSCDDDGYISNENENKNENKKENGKENKKREKNQKIVKSKNGRKKTGYNLDGSKRCETSSLVDVMIKIKEEHELTLSEMKEMKWCKAKIKAYQNRKTNIEGYYYRLLDKSEIEPKQGKWDKNEHKLFMQRAKEFGINAQWGMFSREIPGRVGYQCSNYWRSLLKKNKVKDPIYRLYKNDKNKIEIGSFRKLPPNRKNDESWMKKYQEMKKFGFTVLDDDSGVFGTKSQLPGKHENSPSKEFIESAIKELTEANGMEMIKDDQSGKKKKKSKHGRERKKNRKERKSRKSRKGGKKRTSKDVIYDSDSDNGENSQNSKNSKRERTIESKKGRERYEKSNENSDFDKFFETFRDISQNKVNQPAIDHCGHVIDYQNWLKIFEKNGKGNKAPCPYSKLQVSRRSLVKLNPQNFHVYYHSIKNK